MIHPKKLRKLQEKVQSFQDVQRVVFTASNETNVASELANLFPSVFTPVSITFSNVPWTMGVKMVDFPSPRILSRF
jgi:hypothetical protein